MVAMLKKIPIDRLVELRDLFKVDYPLHMSTVSTLDRFAKFPEWIERVSFISFIEDWKTCGAFVMTNGSRIFFNTLEVHPFEKLKKILILMNFDCDKMNFVHIRDNLRPLLFDAIRIHHYEITSDIGTKCYRFPKKELLKLKIDPHEGLELKPLRKEHVSLINSLWSGKFKGSEKFIEEAIELNPSLGVYKKNGELLAWNMRIDNGSMGVGQVEQSHQGNMYGHLAVISLAVKTARECDCDVHFEVVNGNAGANKSAKRSQLEIVDTQSWVGVKRREKLKAAPLWGHL